MAPEADHFDIDPNLLQDFLAESSESLQGVNELFVQLENAPEDQGIIDSIFRPVHSVKGNSAFFGLTNIKQFSHALENLLQEIRSGNLKANKSIIDALLEGTDLLQGMIGRLASGDTSVELLPREQELLEQVNGLRKGESDQPTALLDKALEKIKKGCDTCPSEIVEEMKSVSQLIEQFLETLRPKSTEKEPTENAYSYFIEDTEVTEQAREIISFIQDISNAEQREESCEKFTKNITALVSKAEEKGKKETVKALGDMRNDFDAIHESGIGFDDLLGDLLREKLDKVLAGVTRKSQKVVQDKPAEADSASAKPENKDKPAPKPAEKSNGGPKTIRVSEDKVDSFMNYVGELLTVSEVFSYVQKKLEKRSEQRDIALELKQAILSFEDLSSNLQKSLMSVRRIPLKNILQKIPRMVRDLSHDLGKNIQLEISGEDIQIDKSLIEKLESPITHMVRNCVDHAVENPEDRKAAGKEEKGTVRLKAECNERDFTLKIIDDGKGLDAESLKAKAVEKGYISEAQAAAMTDRDAYQLIFGAGVSTAKKITEVSGRGVGMDVVRTNILEMKGNIEIDSEKGKGTTFTITLPMTVTLIVVDGLLARVGEETYIIPLENVKESVHPAREDITSVSGKGEMVSVRGVLYPIMRIYKHFNQKADFTTPWETVLVICETPEGACALMVDELIGQQAVVLKDMSKYFTNLKALKGGAILGSGRVGLVIDIEHLVSERT